MVLEATCVKSESQWHDTLMLTVSEIDHGIIRVRGPWRMGVNADMTGGIFTGHRPQLARVNAATIYSDVWLGVTIITTGVVLSKYRGPQWRGDPACFRK
jgi:hypothetical protein